MIRILIVLGIMGYHSLVYSQEVKQDWTKKIKQFQLEPVIGIQLWSTYTVNTEVYDETTQVYNKVDNRINTQLRRSRLGIKGEPYPNFKFNFTASLDLVGKDDLAGTYGKGNNGSSPKFRIWNAYVQWKIQPNSDALHLTAGYFIPQIGRESITAALRSTSMEKSWSQNYLRRHLTGIGPGRSMGMNLGGKASLAINNLEIGYDLGVFNPLFQVQNVNTTGARFAPLLVGRMALYFGDPEQKGYSISHKVNYFSKRNGISIAIAGAHQGITDLFEKNQAIGGDWLLNWKHLNLDGEWTFLKRTGISNFVDNSSTTSVTLNTGYIRMSYNIHLQNHWILEPVFMIMQFNGPLDNLGQSTAALLASNSGKDHSLNIGGNLYFTPELKLSIHYTFRNGHVGEMGYGATVNNYFFQSGVGAIRRGEWFGLGLVAIL